LNEVERARLAAPVPAGVQAIQRSQPIGPAPIAGPAYPVAPGPFPSSAAPAPVVTTPPTAAPIYAVPGNAPAQSFQTQPRAPY
jgi:hypothetical protein